MEKLELWEERNISDMDPTFERCRLSNELEANKKTFQQYLGCLARTVVVLF